MRRQGADIRKVQERLGHQRIQTTLRYDRFTPPVGVVNPADALPSLRNGRDGVPAVRRTLGGDCRDA